MCLLPSSEDRTTDLTSQAKKKLKEFFDSFRPDFISYSGTGIIRELFKVTRIFKRKEETNKETNKNSKIRRGIPGRSCKLYSRSLTD